MWIFLVLSLAAGVYSDMEDIYTDWIAVMSFPNNVDFRNCLKYNLKRNDIECSCDDGKNTTLVDFHFAKRSDVLHQKKVRSYPVLEVNNAAEVIPSLSISCTCGQEYYKNRLVTRSINKDYYILYENFKNLDFYSPTEPNSAVVQAKEVQNISEMQKIVGQDEELSRRNGKIVCSQEILNSP